MMVSNSEIRAARVLVVDDQQANVALLEQMLRDAGYSNITSTQRPQEVCALHDANDYDLILLDLNMPRMDGFAVMQGLAAGDADRYLPVIVHRVPRPPRSCRDGSGENTCRARRAKNHIRAAIFYRRI